MRRFGGIASFFVPGVRPLLLLAVDQTRQNQTQDDAQAAGNRNPHGGVAQGKGQKQAQNNTGDGTGYHANGHVGELLVATVLGAG